MTYQDLGGLTPESFFNVEEFRERLRKMSDAGLIKTGRDLAFLCSPKQNLGKPPREVWAVQFMEARAEWRRGHPSQTANGMEAKQ